MSRAEQLRVPYLIALTGYFGLLLLLLLWNTWLSPPAKAPIAVMLIVLVVPLLLPLRGLLHGRLYTYRWVPFLALIYLALGIVTAYAQPEERLLGLLETAFSLLLYGGAFFYVRGSRRS